MEDTEPVRTINDPGNLEHGLAERVFSLGSVPHLK